MMISDLKITPEKETEIIAKVLIKNIKTKNENKWFELKLEDKSGTINALLFPKNNFDELNELIKENEIYKFKGKYSEKFKNFNITEIKTEISEEEIQKNIRLKKQIDTENLKNEILHLRKNIKNKFLLFVYDMLIKKDLEYLLTLPATAFKTFSYKGGLLKRNYEIYKHSMNLISIKELNLNKDLIILGSLLLDLGRKDTCVNEKEINELGQLIPNDIIVLEKIELLWLQWLENNGIVIENAKKEINEYKIEQEKLSNKRKELKEEYLKLIQKEKDIQKEIEETEKINSDLIKQLEKYSNDLEKLNQKIKELDGKLKKTRKEEIKKELQNEINKLEEQRKNIESTIDNTNKNIKENNELIGKDKNIIETLKEEIKNIVNEGKAAKENIGKIQNKINELEDFIEEKIKYLKNVEIIKNKLKHILLTNTYYITNKESNFPRFEEAQIIALSTCSIINFEFFLEEIRYLKEITEHNTETRGNYSNKLNKYLFLK